MAEYKSICRSCFHSYVCEQFNEHRECDNKKCHFANDHFVPTADVVEVRHGTWYKAKDGYTRCSRCDSRGSAIKARYCHHCGAKMDGKDGAG